jgi:hypothetical protein
MTRTKNMIYKETAEAQELYIFANNERRIYDMMQYVEASLKKKVDKGIYDADKAIDAFYHVMCEASNLYRKMFGYGFTVGDRFTAAADFAREFTEEVTA